MSLFSSVRAFFASLFSRNPQEAQKKRELKKIHKYLATARPPVYRPKGNLAMPGLARTVYEFYQLLRPVRDIVRRSVAHKDSRLSQRYRDFLIESRLDEEGRRLRELFRFEGLDERLRASMRPDEEVEYLNRDFNRFITCFDKPELRGLDAELGEVERLAEICRYDFERVLGFFDPGINLDDPTYSPDFSPAGGSLVKPELIDLLYVIDGFWFTPEIEAALCRLAERIAPPGADMGEQARKLAKIVAMLNKMLTQRLDRDLLLSLLRSFAGDPWFTPQGFSEKHRIVEEYKARIAAQYQRDRDRLLRERQESSLSKDIEALFGDADLLSLEGYNDEINALLHEESAATFSHIKPMRILKSFVYMHYEAGFKDPLKRVLVEGYFDHKSFQNNLSNVFYLCEKIQARIAQFEEGLTAPGRVSIQTMKRYLEESKRGKDVAPFLSKLVDTVNLRAKEIVGNDSNLLNTLARSMLDVVNDYKSPTPEVISNIRTLGGAKNKDIIAAITTGVAATQKFVRVMRNFTVIERAAERAEPAPEEGAIRAAEAFAERSRGGRASGADEDASED